MESEAFSSPSSVRIHLFEKNDGHYQEKRTGNFPCLCVFLHFFHFLTPNVKWMVAFGGGGAGGGYQGQTLGAASVVCWSIDEALHSAVKRKTVRLLLAFTLDWLSLLLVCTTHTGKSDSLKRSCFTFFLCLCRFSDGMSATSTRRCRISWFGDAFDTFRLVCYMNFSGLELWENCRTPCQHLTSDGQICG